LASSHVVVHKPVPVGLPDGTTNTFVRKQIRKLRILKGWTQRELAYAAGISASSLGCLETGFYRLNLDTLQKIIQALGVEISDVWPSHDGSNRVEPIRPPQRGRDQIHFYRLAEVHSLTGAEASCLFASNLHPAPGPKPGEEAPHPELRALYTVRMGENERWWLSHQLSQGSVAPPWVAYAHRENNWALYLCLKSPSMEPWIEKLIRCYLSEWVTAVPF
jgi:transcriptional regulator with XRE-family HTH domain